MNRKSLLTVIIILSVPLVGAHSAVPNLISYQGVLTDSTGAPLPDGTHLMVFQIYDAPTGGNMLWSSTFRQIVVTGGLFNYNLGDTVALPDSLFLNNSNLWLGIKVDFAPEMMPRIRLTSAGYAIHALRSDSSSISSTVYDGAITNAKIAPNAVATTQLEAGSVTSDKIVDAAITNVKIASETITGSRILDGTIGGADIDSSQVQLRVTGIAGPGRAIRAINSDGSIGEVAVGSGDITGVTAGTGLVGGGASGAVTLSVDEGVVPFLSAANRFTGTNRFDGNILGNISMDSSSVTGGNILKGGALFIHNYGTDNTYIGFNAGKIGVLSDSNTACGSQVLSRNVSGARNSACGAFALQNNLTGDDNTAMGFAALQNDSTGNGNTAVGALTLQNNRDGVNNTASGYSALASNTSGSLNTAYGRSALTANNTGAQNTASGSFALANNINGGNNTACGYRALNFNTTGSYNTACGNEALRHSANNHFNTALGAFALFSNINGNKNTACGDSALYSNSSGYRNTACGTGALRSNTTGYENTAIGFWANVSSGGLYNATAIGAGARVDASNKIRLGNLAVTVIEGNVAYTFSSDRNKKENFQPVDGKEVLRKIREFELTSWNYKGNEPNKFRHYGPMAQDFFAAFGNDGVGQCGDSTTINSGDMAGILMIAVQTLSKENEDLNARLKALESRINKRTEKNIVGK